MASRVVDLQDELESLRLQVQELSRERDRLRSDLQCLGDSAPGSGVSPVGKSVGFGIWCWNFRTEDPVSRILPGSYTQESVIEDLTRQLKRAHSRLEEEIHKRVRIERILDAVPRTSGEAELAHVSRHAMMGEMATGLAHELNQPLTSIGSFAFACGNKLPKALANYDELAGYLSEIEGQKERAAEIILRIRSFVRKSDPQVSVHDLNKIIRDSLHYVRADANLKTIDIALDCDSENPSVRVDRIQIEQVVLNLVRNACEAMSDVDEDTRKLTVRTCKLDSGWVEVSVEDSGPGMPETVLGHAFNAFFTTKKDGLGMGLPICRSLIESHGGRLWGLQNQGSGMTFMFSLPCHEGE